MRGVCTWGRRVRYGMALVVAFLLVGCKRFQVTAVPLSAWNRGEPEGIPFYLPKPLLIVAKNVRWVETEKVGLTDSSPIPNHFDDQSKYADLNARTDFRGLPAGQTTRIESAGSTASTVASSGTASVSGQHLYSPSGAPARPASAPADGLLPETFFTYQIVFVPDLTQKYGLRIRGGPGEVRAALNLVNGWMFTGLGPFYLKDSTTAQNMLATGIAANLAAAGVSDVVRGLAELREAPTVEAAQVERIAERIEAARAPKFALQPGTLERYAEIYIFEPSLTADGQLEWRQIAALSFDRDYLGYYSPSDSQETPSDRPSEAGDKLVPHGQARAPQPHPHQARGRVPEAALLQALLSGSPAFSNFPALPSRPPRQEAAKDLPPKEAKDGGVRPCLTTPSSSKVRFVHGLPLLRLLAPRSVQEHRLDAQLRLPRLGAAPQASDHSEELVPGRPHGAIDAPPPIAPGSRATTN